MRRLVVVGLLLLVGCQSVVGPRQRRDNPERVDPPGLSIDEQQRRGRDRLAYPDPSPAVGPRTGSEPPDVRYGR